MKPFLILLLGILILSCHSFAEEVDLREAILSAKEDIGSATETLNEIRAEISVARKPLAVEIQTLESELAILRREANILRRNRGAERGDLDNLRREAGEVRQEVRFTQALLLGFRREIGVRAAAAEKQGLVEELNKIDVLFREEDSLKKAGPLLRLTGERLYRNLGGAIFAGYCFDEEGILHPGKFVLAGPVNYFISRDKTIAGLTGLRPGSLKPSIIFNLDVGGIRELAEGREAVVPLDFTLGRAIEIEGFRKTWIEHLKGGGFVMIPILALGLFCLVLIIWKFFFLKKLQINIGSTLSEILRLLRHEKIDLAEKKAKSVGHPLAAILLEGIEHRDAPKEHLEEIMHERILSEAPLLEKHLPILAVCAAAAPLLGLLGTVTGMIHTFDLVTIFGTGEARLLSDGISEALITTQYGLIIAIPALLIHAYLSRRVRSIIETLEQTAIGFVNGLKLKQRNFNSPA